MAVCQTRAEADSIMEKVKAAGFVGRVLPSKEGFEVAYFREMTPEISKAIKIYERVLNKGPQGASPAEHRLVGKVFGRTDEQIAEYLTGNGLIKSRGVLSRLGERWFGEAIEEGLPDTSGRFRIVNMLSGTKNSGSPFIRAMGDDYTQAWLANRSEITQWKAKLDQLKELVPNAERAHDLAEGTVEPANARETQWRFLKQQYMDDFAKRAIKQGLLKENRYIQNYATHATDMDAVYTTLREQFVGAETYRDLDQGLRMKLTPEQYQRYRDSFLLNPVRQGMPEGVWKAVLKDVKDWSDVASTSSQLPEFIRNNLPKHVYVKFFQPRWGKSLYTKDYYTNTAEYMDDALHAMHWQPVIDKWDPIMAKLRGMSDNGAFYDWTEKGYMERLRNNVALRRPSGDQQALTYMTSMFNETLGRNILRVNDINAFTKLTKDAFLRGTVGLAPDSAIRHSTHLVTAWLENGRFAGPFAKSLVKLGRVNAPDIFQEFMPMYENTIRDMRGNDNLFSQNLHKAAAFSDTMTKYSLSPISLSENVAKGTAFVGGVEDAVARGIADPAEMLHIGFAAASDVVPDLKISEAHWAGINSMLKTQTTMLPHLRSPLMTSGPLLRLSNIFMVWPTHAMQYVNLGLRRALAESVMKNEQARLIRFMAFGGGLYTLHQAGKYTGMNFDDFFGDHAFTLLTSVPYYRTIINGARAVMGEPSIATDAAKRAFIEAVKQETPLYPSWRFGGKMKDIVDNIERGYAVDRMAHRLYEVGNGSGPFYTSEFGEMMRAIGVKPQAAINVRRLSMTLAAQAYERSSSKTAAIRSWMDQGDASSAMRWTMKYGENISQADIMREMNKRTQPFAQQMLQRAPTSLRPGLIPLLSGEEDTP